jgi:tRNA(Ile)-lysidine synthase TilS/MesJ
MECSRCGRTAVLELKYFKEFLCDRCFNDLFEKRVKRSIRAGRLLGKRDVVVVGFSGCRDSAVLLTLFKKIFFKAPKSRLIALTVDDELAGRVGFTKDFCRKLGVEHHVYKAGRDLWKTLEGKARLLKADKIALGVNLDDEVSNTLDCIFRGKKLDDSRPKVIKPLRECLKEEVEKYAKLNKIKFIKARKSKSEFRKNIASMLDEIESKQPGSKFKLLKSTDKYKRATKQAH